MKSKSFKNIASGIFGQLVSIAFGVYIPRLVILALGSESNGLTNSIATVLGYLNLLEAGIGVTSLQSLYGPVAREEREEINSILSATKLYYKKTGLYYALGIIGISIIYPLVVESTIPLYIIIAVILLSGLPNVINFYFQGKYKILLQADGKNYVLTNVQTVTTIVTSLGKVLILNSIFIVSSGNALIFLQGMYFGVSILQMIFFEWYIRRRYGWLKLNVKPKIEALGQKNSALIHQVSGLIFSTTDIVILSIMCNLKTVSMYSIYVLLFGMIATLVQNINGGVIYKMGQTFNVDRERYLKMHDAFEIYNMAITFGLYAVANIFIVPFINLYTMGAEITYVDHLLPYLFIATFLLENGRTASMKVITYAGHFRQTRWHAIVEVIINITASVIGAYIWGIYGVLFGTVLALFFRSNAMILYAGKNILKKSVWPTYYHWITNVIIFAFVTIISKLIFRNINLNSYISIVLWAIVSTIIVLFVFIALNSLLNKKTWRYVKDSYIKKIIKR